MAFGAKLSAFSHQPGGVESWNAPRFLAEPGRVGMEATWRAWLPAADQAAARHWEHARLLATVRRKLSLQQNHHAFERAGIIPKRIDATDKGVLGWEQLLLENEDHFLIFLNRCRVLVGTLIGVSQAPRDRWDCWGTIAVSPAYAARRWRTASGQYPTCQGCKGRSADHSASSPS